MIHSASLIAPRARALSRRGCAILLDEERKEYFVDWRTLDGTVEGKYSRSRNERLIAIIDRLTNRSLPSSIHQSILSKFSLSVRRLLARLRVALKLPETSIRLFVCVSRGSKFNCNERTFVYLRVKYITWNNALKHEIYRRYVRSVFWYVKFVSGFLKYECQIALYYWFCICTSWKNFEKQSIFARKSSMDFQNTNVKLFHIVNSKYAQVKKICALTSRDNYFSIQRETEAEKWAETISARIAPCYRNL